MKTTLSLWVLVVLFAAKAHAIVRTIPPTPTPLVGPSGHCVATDVIYCTVALFGSEREGAGPLFRSDATLGGCRRGGKVSDTGESSTIGSAALMVRLGPSELEAQLHLRYRHYMQTDASGKTTKATQQVYLQGDLFNNGINVTNNGAPARGGSKGPSDLVSVVIVDGVPRLDVNEIQFIETVSGAAVLKVACSSSALQPVGPIY